MYPYIICNPDTLGFRVISNFEDGCSLIMQLKKFIQDFKSCIDHTQVNAKAFGRSEKVNKTLRALSGAFLSDVVSVFLYPRLCKATLTPWQLLLEVLLDAKRMAIDPQHSWLRSFPERFDKLSAQLWNLIREANAQGHKAHVSTKSATTTAEKAACPTTAARPLEVTELVQKPSSSSSSSGNTGSYPKTPNSTPR